MHHGIMIPMSDNPAKMEIDEEGLIVGVTNHIRTIRYFGKQTLLHLHMMIDIEKISDSNPFLIQ